jgi:acetyltransferase-like isoleucine patch superfamily enzyme
VKELVTIGTNAVVAMGAVVINNVGATEVVADVPAQKLART